MYLGKVSRGEMPCLMAKAALTRADRDKDGNPAVAIVFDTGDLLKVGGQIVNVAWEVTPAVAREFAAAILNSADEADPS